MIPMISDDGVCYFCWIGKPEFSGKRLPIVWIKGWQTMEFSAFAAHYKYSTVIRGIYF